MDELLDIVDKNDNVVGEMFRFEIYKRNLSCFRVVNAFIKNIKGQLWIPRRSAEKKLFPWSLDCSVGGHVKSGETYEEAFEREAMEELGIDVKEVNFREIGYLSPKEYGVSAFMKVFEIKQDVDPHYNRNDFCECGWMFPHELVMKIQKGEPCKGDLPRLLECFYR